MLAAQFGHKNVVELLLSAETFVEDGVDYETVLKDFDGGKKKVNLFSIELFV